MARERLFIVHGTGPDRVGLVGSITTPMARAGGNIVDLRQDVLHGLFTIFMVVDLSRTELRVAELTKMVKDIAEDTGLDLRVDTYTPVARQSRRTTMLLVLIGPDKPGIIASITETLAKYQINIELAQMVAREGIFLMELMVDLGHCTLPLSNTCDVLTSTMKPLGITTLFQTESVFNKKKRVVLFDIRASLIDSGAISEIARQTGIESRQIRDTAGADTSACVASAAHLLEGVPAQTLERVAAALTPTAATMELVQTLRIMGYTIALSSPSFAPLLEPIRRSLDIDHAFGAALDIDDDSRTVTGERSGEFPDGPAREEVVAALASRAQVSRSDITVVADSTDGLAGGIRLDLNLGVLIDMYNNKSLGRAALTGILCALGMPRV